MVRDELKKLLTLTEQIQGVLKEKVTGKNRDEVIEQVEKFIEEREQLLQRIKAPYTDEEKKIGQHIVTVNKTIDQKMAEIFQLLKDEIKQMNRHKKSNPSYENPYQSLQTMDGMFLDEKK